MIIRRPIDPRLHRMAMRRRIIGIGTRTPASAHLIGYKLTYECWIKYLSNIIIFCWGDCIPTLYPISVRDTWTCAHLAPVVKWSRTYMRFTTHVFRYFITYFRFWLRRSWNLVWTKPTKPMPSFRSMSAFAASIYVSMTTTILQWWWVNSEPNIGQWTLYCQHVQVPIQM